MLGADITSFADVRRDDGVHSYLRRTMYGTLERAAGASRLPWPRCRRDDRGDGAMIVLPPGTRAAGVLDALPPRLHALLRHANHGTSDVQRLRLRLAADVGAVNLDEYGTFGRPFIQVARMLDAPPFKAAMAAADADVGLLVSDHLFRSAAPPAWPISRDAYRPLRFTCKETRADAHLWLPRARPVAR